MQHQTRATAYHANMQECVNATWI